MQKRVERAALPSYMQEQVEKLEQAGYKVLETCQIDDTYTAGVERQGAGGDGEPVEASLKIRRPWREPDRGAP